MSYIPSVNIEQGLSDDFQYVVTSNSGEASFLVSMMVFILLQLLVTTEQVNLVS